MMRSRNRTSARARTSIWDVDDWKSRVDKMREANIPLEGEQCQAMYSTLLKFVIVQWVDIDFYDRYRDFTSDPKNYPMERVKEFLSFLVRIL